MFLIRSGLVEAPPWSLTRSGDLLREVVGAVRGVLLNGSWCLEGGAFFVVGFLFPTGVFMSKESRSVEIINYQWTPASCFVRTGFYFSFVKWKLWV